MSIRAARIRTFAIALAGWLLLAGNVHADVVFTVNSVLDQIDDDTSDGICHTAAGTCTLRAAVMSANKATGPGVTIMLPAGTYTLVRPAGGASDDSTGSLKLLSPPSGSTTITITGAGAGVTIIDANQIDRVFDVESRQASISGVTFRNGYVSGLDGGGIYDNGTLTLADCVISNSEASGGAGGGIYVANSPSLSAPLTISGTTLDHNMADGGGGIYSQGDGDILADTCTISNNKALTGAGGGIFAAAAGTLSVNNCTLTGNSTVSTGGGIAAFTIALLDHDDVGFNSADTDGGGIANYAVLLLNHVGIHNNTAGMSGGGLASFEDLLADHSTIRDNVATIDGGGIHYHASSASVEANMARSTISGNIAHADGGGIWTDSVMYMTNTTIALNGSDGNGGGIFITPQTYLNVNLYNSTIAANDADQDQDFAGSGGGVFLNGTGGNGFNLYNTILAQNIVSNHQEYDDCSAVNGGVLKTHARNLFGSGNGCTIVQISGSYAALSENSLGGLQNNGGPTQTIALHAGSNAIDGAIAGVGCRDSQAAAIATDQRGYARGADSACDIGAYEYNDIFADGFQAQ